MVDLGGGQDGPIEHGFSNTVFIVPGIIFVSLSDISNKQDGLPSQEELLENLEKMNLSDTLKEELREGILRGTAQVKSSGTMAILGEISVLLILISLVFLVLVFFGYKLYKSLVERERKRQEKRLQKQQKKKK
ncbi:unnamed protein product [Callosobruchus maculatus]|uniref:Uncharacterized protein n=1 Tax=Callosobruchus maculatus TaxID=64391 RepID=A0A653C9W4_CALMS|nr:unnamed protein product [Callosobruchus maculatus]